ncbi:MAG: GH1 family beta-glucosidase [Athalassotoga sp.]
MTEKILSDDFLWGVATSAYQIEGSPLSDGAGPSIWHRFSHTPGTTYHGDTGDVACDHYNRYKADVQLIKSLGFKAYRFSISWSRIFPYGKGRVNEKGMDFYDKLVDELLKAEIVPFATLYHWDLPAALQDLGGWTNRDVANWFGDYADYLFQRLGDRVKYWSTINEPWVIAVMGYMYGVHAPGIKDIFAAFSVIHNQLRSHSNAVRAFRERNVNGKIGITLSNRDHQSASDDQKDLNAAKIANAFFNYPLFLEPIFNGSYPKEMDYLINAYMPKGYEKDLDEIKMPVDFVINYYSKGTASYDRDDPLGFKSTVNLSQDNTNAYFDFYGFLKNLQDTYDLKETYFTIGGIDCADMVENGKVHDKKRIDFLKSQKEMIVKAVKDGLKLKGCFIWSLMDNFEWSFGYSKRFGIVYVDYKTQKRVVKDSGKMQIRGD